MFYLYIKVSKAAKIRNQYNQVSHLAKDTNGKVTISQLDITNESQEVSINKQHLSKTDSSSIK